MEVTNMLNNSNINHTPIHTDPRVRIIRLPAVLEMVGLCRSSFYNKVKEGIFPKPTKLGRVSGWLEGEITDCIYKQVNAQRNTDSTK
ncbi:AlpA family phage regulatory protein [Iodobacter sp. CM08]|uniref:helix-turn-helix transcriptional regulator n=1 Tax=Iodobacter sp. CM08 TaxID=3085902 RepID=UPI002980DE25|nr:AlpA family phage regulatory protein [Iodobacter sp. CM08]MDW5417468.1 AlpA family phage regulatory protein [Iodobacter sp. CM08]